MQPHRITEKTFYKYLKSPAWVERYFKEGDIRDPLMQTLQDEGFLPARERLLVNKKAVEVDLDDVDEAALRTVELMKKGTETIYKGVLQYEHWMARPDVLERVEGSSVFGDWYYVAADVKRSSRLKDEYKLQGAFYAEVLKKIQKTKPVKGYVIHPSGDISEYLIEEAAEDFTYTLDAIERIYDGETEEHFLTSGYKQSPYFDTFVEEVKALDHLSLLNRVWKSEIYALQDAGIKTVNELANASIDRLHGVSGVTMDRLYFLQQQAISMVEDRFVIVGPVDLPEEPGEALVIDIESDPLQDADYLFGVLEVGDGEPVYREFFAERPEDEEKNWHAFTAYLEQHHTKRIYHYGWYEVDVFRKLTERYGAPEVVRKQFEERMVDVLTYMRGSVIFPMPFYSLKDIAKYLGFSWRSEEANGLLSVIWYEDYLNRELESVRKKIVEYNEDDVRATWFVREWAMEHAKKAYGV